MKQKTLLDYQLFLVKKISNENGHRRNKEYFGPIKGLVKL
jgi:hypothetical protein